MTYKLCIYTVIASMVPYEEMPSEANTNCENEISEISEICCAIAISVETD